jgi:hypothetical protein
MDGTDEEFEIETATFSCWMLPPEADNKAALRQYLRNLHKLKKNNRRLFLVVLSRILLVHSSLRNAY